MKQISPKRHVPFSLIKAMNTLLVMIPFIAVWALYYESRSMVNHSKQSSALLLMTYAVIFFLINTRLDGFRASIFRVGDLIFSQVISVGFTDACAAVLIWMLSIHFPNLLPGLACFGVQVVIVIILCPIIYKIFIHGHNARKTIIIYDFRHGMDDMINEYGLDRRYDVIAIYTIEEVVDELSKLDAAEDVFICGIHSHERNIVMKYCIKNDIRTFILPRIGDVVMSGATRMHMFHLPFLRVTRYNPSWGYRFVKRTFDIVVSGIAMIVLSPVFLVTAIAVKSDGGPALYKQVRLTKDAKEFKILKFRSMRVDAEKYSGAVLSAGENDPRITKVGRFIRACRLDELPQLINIFVGDMSIVGPRPERPEIASKYEEEFGDFSMRLQAKAGLTGYAQVYGKYNTTPYDKTLMDLMYIARPSIFEDLSIMLATVKILFSKESTEGVGAETVELEYRERD